MTKKKQRRKPGEGQIDQLRSGRWRARITVGGKRRSLGTCDTEAEARDLLDAAREQLATGEMILDDAMTLAELGELWFEHLRQNGRKRIKNREYLWNKWIRDTSPIGGFAVASIRRRDVRDLHRMLLRHLAPRSADLVLSYVRSALEFAVDDELIASNPARYRLEARAPVEEGESWTYLRPDEQHALVTCEAIPVADRALIKVLMGTGLRAGELTSLVSADLITEGEHPRIILRKTKTKSPRTVPLFGMALDGAREWRALHGAGRGSAPAFPAAEGGFRSANAVFGRVTRGQRRFAMFVKAAGIQRRVRTHDLRHTCASSLIAGWWGRRWSLMEVKELLGHKTINQTQRYAHLAPDVLADAARATRPAEAPRDGEEANGNGCVSCGIESEERKLCPHSEMQCGSSRIPAIQAVSGESRDECGADAAAILTAIAAGTYPAAEAEALARSILLADRVTAAALRVLEGGEFAPDAAAELCSALIRSGVASRQGGAR